MRGRKCVWECVSDIIPSLNSLSFCDCTGYNDPKKYLATRGERQNEPRKLVCKKKKISGSSMEQTSPFFSDNFRTQILVKKHAHLKIYSRIMREWEKVQKGSVSVVWKEGFTKGQEGVSLLTSIWKYLKQQFHNIASGHCKMGIWKRRRRRNVKQKKCVTEKEESSEASTHTNNQVWKGPENA